MRDVVVTLIIFGSLPFIFKRPYIGVLMWIWVSVMNPHMLGWGFAATMPLAQAVAVVTLVSLLLSKEPKNLPMTGVTKMMIAFIVWMNITTVFAFYPDISLVQWNKVMKIFLMILVTMMIIKMKQQIQLVIWVLVISLGFYGVKGGIFTLIGGGEDLVMGPRATFISGNNELALALIMTIPLMAYLIGASAKKWMRWALFLALILTALAALGTHSRGALVAIAFMGMLLWCKSPHKGKIGVLLILAVPLVFMLMPDKWTDRMSTIKTYEQDESAMGRINAWWMAFNLAADRPLVGGGFEVATPELFQAYAPNPNDLHAAHSIYFQALGEHGFVGLALFLALGLAAWRTGRWIIRNADGLEGFEWAIRLTAMIQVSLAGYAVGAAFLSLLYFDLPYYLMAVLVSIQCLLKKELESRRRLRSMPSGMPTAHRASSRHAPPSTVRRDLRGSHVAARRQGSNDDEVSNATV